MQGSAACPARNGAGPAKPSPVPCTFIARRPSFETSDRMVLASLVADLGPLPDCPGYLRRLLHCSDRAARSYRDSLAADGIVTRTSDGWLVVDEVGFTKWKERAAADFTGRGLRFAFDAVPVAALAWGCSTAELRALANHFGEAVGAHAARPGCRSDAERSAQAGVSRRYVIEARKKLAEHGCRVVGRRVAFRLPEGGVAEKLLQRVELPDDDARSGLCRRPSILSRRSKLAAVAAALAGRKRVPTVGRNSTSGRWSAPAPSATKEQGPSATKAGLPIAPAEGATPSPRPADLRDGPSEPETGMGGPLDPAGVPEHVAELSRVAQCGGNLLDLLTRRRAEQNPRQQAEQAKDREASTRERAQRLLADGPRLERAVAGGRTVDLLAAFGVFDRCDRLPQHKAGPLLDRRRHGLALRLAQLAGSTPRAALVAVLIGAATLRAQRVRSLGAVVAKRLERFLAEADLVAVAGAWAGLDVQAVAAVFRGERPAPRTRGERRTDTTPIAKDHTQHPEVRRAVSALIGAAQAGDWRAFVRRFDAMPRELCIDVRTVSDRSGVPEAGIEAGIAAERARLAATFAARRATA